MTNYKTLLINLGSFGISMTNIDVALKIILLGITIGYTVQKWYLLNENKEVKPKRNKKK
jgi:predicted RND superfamily exporter protein